MYRRAYTLIELLAALTIIVVLASLLAPVFIQVKEEAKQAACSFNFKQVNLSANLYSIDYEDRYVLSKYRGGNTDDAFTDRTWVQLIQPYLRSFESTICPSDYSRQPGKTPVFDPDLVVNSSIERFYTASKRANTGYNFVYLSPMVKESNGLWTSKPRSTSELGDPSRTLVYGDSAWEQLDGRPIGGGSYLIVPPCRYLAPDRTDSFNLGTYNNDRIYTASKVWDEIGNRRDPRIGGLWPWHSGRLTAVMADGSIKSLTVAKIADGCDVRQRWGGYITDVERYVWDLR